MHTSGASIQKLTAAIDSLAKKVRIRFTKATTKQQVKQRSETMMMSQVMPPNKIVRYLDNVS